ncbi:unnamed protein product [Anisakis simplex]|uniref:Uncharacterized protein n=1 Tax=Anisakis simplex TaxID=6269 RepID=A0A0M3JCS6_ANISI|nr:unnamed protein product [Anisakis simplex]
MAPNADVVTAASREPPRAIVFETFDDGNQASSRRRSSYESRKRSTAAELATRSINATANSTSFDVFQQTNTRKPVCGTTSIVHANLCKIIDTF